MAKVTIAVDLAKNVFEIAIAGRAGTIQHRKRMSRWSWTSVAEPAA